MGAKSNMAEQAIVCTEADVRTALLTKGGENAKKVANNPKLLGTLTGILKGVVEKDAAATIASGVSLADQQYASSGASRNTKMAVKGTSFVVSQTQLSWGMNAVTKLSPGRAIAFVGATTVTKPALLLGMAGDEHERLQCAGAIMELAGSAGLTAATGWTGVGAVLGVASIAASAVNAYDACIAE